MRVSMTPFTKKVMAVVKKIPKGRVATYGQIAALAGQPSSARGVGWILNSCSRVYQLPWQRVINSKGKISFDPQSKEHRIQKKLLQQEKIQFLIDGSISLTDYGWKKKPRRQKAQANRPSLFR